MPLMYIAPLYGVVPPIMEGAILVHRLKGTKVDVARAVVDERIQMIDGIIF